MGLDSTSLPQSVLRLMSKEQRAPLGKAGETYEEAQERTAVKLERELHDRFTNWLNLRRLLFIHARTDKKSTIRKGWPDFTVIYGDHVCCVEFKRPGGKLRSEQVEVIKRMLQTNTPVIVADDFKAASDFVMRTLKPADPESEVRA